MTILSLKNPEHETFSIMKKSYYDPADLKKFENISEFQPELGKKFFDYYGAVFQDGALTSREKSLIALAVSHAVQCPYCIDAYSEDSLEKGATEEQMMEAVHVAGAIRGGASLVHGVQMMNKVKGLTM
jgi:alkylhydroperoxidase/carboxymuconolactone decarboxylase family protein